MAVYRDEHLLDPDGRGIKRLAATSQRMAKVAGVRDVLSLAEGRRVARPAPKEQAAGDFTALWGASRMTGPARRSSIPTARWPPAIVSYLPAIHIRRMAQRPPSCACWSRKVSLTLPVRGASRRAR